MILRFRERDRNDVHSRVDVFCGMGDETSTAGLAGSLTLDTAVWDDLLANGFSPPRYIGNVHCSISDDSRTPDPDPVLGHCVHGVNLDRDVCERGCRV